MEKTFKITIEEMETPPDKILRESRMQKSEKIKKAVRESMKKAGVTLAEFGEACQVKRQAIHHLIFKPSRLTTKGIERLSRGLAGLQSRFEKKDYERLVEMIGDYRLIA